MSDQNIGGHDNQFGKMLVFRDEVPGRVEHSHIDQAPPAVATSTTGRTVTEIRKAAYDQHNVESLMNEAQCCLIMGGSGYAPNVLRINHEGHTLAEGALTEVVYEDFGQNVTHTDGEALRHSAIRLLATMRQRGLRHGDLTAPNIIMRDNRMQAIDWAESHALAVEGPQKQPWSDSFMLMRFLAGTAAADGQMDTPRVARRWMAVLTDLEATTHVPALPLVGQTFVDLGCFQGDFVALAAAEGMHATGVDQGGFQSGRDSLAIGEQLFRGTGITKAHPTPTWVKADLIDFVKANDVHYDVAMCFSAWPYLVNDYGHEAALAWLALVIERSGVLYFETQLAGDGPGPDFLPDKAAVVEMLLALGGVATELVTIPVTGRPAERTVWAVRSA